MNATQIKYATARADAIKSNLLAGLKATYTIQPTFLSTKEKLKAIEEGQYALLPCKSDERGYWHNYVVFIHEVMAGFKPGYEDAVKAVNLQHRDLMDQLVLGSSEEAIRMLEAFASGPSSK